MYGCECAFEADSEPWGKPRRFSPEEIDALPAWTPERFEQSEPVREVVAQFQYLRKHYDIRPPADPAAFCPHFRLLNSLQNLGSVINTATTVQGEDLLEEYVLNPERVRRCFANITELMLLCLRFFPELDGCPLRDVFIGNCSVAMISPQHYRELNQPFDRVIADYARQIGARFTMHQDSGVTPHLENYATLGEIHGFDFGQDTNLEKAAQVLPRADGSCILFPSWVKEQSADTLREELLRLMRLGKRFPAFQFTLYEIDPFLAGDKIVEFYEVFRQCAEQVSGERP